jgi:hypothetical protein
MIQLRHLLLLLCLISGLASCAQKPFVKTYAYTMERSFGNIAVDENGHPRTPNRDTAFYLYLETDRDTPTLTHVWKNNRMYEATAIPVTKFPFLVGMDKNTNQKIYLSPAKGHRLWQIQLNMSAENKPAPLKLEPKEVVIQGKLKRKTFTKKLSGQTEIYQPMQVE